MAGCKKNLSHVLSVRLPPTAGDRQEHEADRLLTPDRRGSKRGPAASTGMARALPPRETRCKRLRGTPRSWRLRILLKRIRFGKASKTLSRLTGCRHAVSPPPWRFTHPDKKSDESRQATKQAATKQAAVRRQTTRRPTRGERHNGATRGRETESAGARRAVAAYDSLALPSFSKVSTA